MTEKKKPKRKGGASGPHKHPIMALRYPAEAQAAWREAAAREGLTLSAYVLIALSEHAKRAPQRRLMASGSGDVKAARKLLKMLDGA